MFIWRVEKGSWDTSHCFGVEEPPANSDAVWNAKTSASIACFWHLSGHIGPFTITFDDEECHCLVFRHVWKIVKSNYWLSLVCLSVCVCTEQLGSTGWIFIKFDIWVFCENLCRKFKFNENWTRVLYMKTFVHSWSSLFHFFLEWGMFQTKVMEKIKTQILCLITFSKKLYCLWDNAEKYYGAVQAKCDIMHMRSAFWILRATNTHSE